MSSLAIVINVGTDVAATLALASLHESVASTPVRLVNCDPTDESRRWFSALSRDLHFQIEERPARLHGTALNDLFTTVDAELVMLLDSDAEIVERDVVSRCLDAFDDPTVFGAGFREGPAWMGPEQGATATPRVAYFQERPWMPFVVFRTSMVREALASGHTFEARKIWNDFPWNARVGAALAARFQDNFVPRSRWVAKVPSRLRERMGTWRFDALRWMRRDVHGTRPNYVLYDTSADLYQWCTYERGWHFVGPDFRTSSAVAHYQGVTRARFRDPYQSAAMSEIEATIRARLTERYGISPAV